MKKYNLEKRHTHCAYCNKEFEKNSEVATSGAAGFFYDKLLHVECLGEYVLQYSTQEYYNSHEDYLIEHGLADK